MKEFKFKVVENAITVELANFIYNYFLLKSDAVKHMYNNNMHDKWRILGYWDDDQVPNTYCCYGDFATETLLLKMIPQIEKYTGHKIVPTYSYTRLYKKGDILASVVVAAPLTVPPYKPVPQPKPCSCLAGPTL